MKLKSVREQFLNEVRRAATEPVKMMAPFKSRPEQTADQIIDLQQACNRRRNQRNRLRAANAAKQQAGYYYAGIAETRRDSRLES